MLFFVPTPIGNLRDISLHSLEVLQMCNVVICEDTRVTKRLLTLLLNNPIIQQYFSGINPSNKKFISFHSHNQDDFLANISQDFFMQDIAFCTDAGMPNISDPGALLLQYVRNHNIPYQVLLGGSAFSHAFVCSGLDGAFYFGGFLPHKQHDRQTYLKLLLEYHKSMHIIIYESPKRLRESLQDMAFIMPDSTIMLYKELTKLYEAEIIGSPQNILERLPTRIKGEYCIIIQKDCKKMSCNSISTQQILRLTQDDILALDIQPKQKAKMLSQISTKSIKEWYIFLMQQK